MGQTSTPAPRALGFLGGTGPQGRGLALRLAAAGHAVWIGSRDPQRAAATADELRLELPAADIASGDNQEVAENAEAVFVTVPYQGQDQLLPPLRGLIGQNVVVSCGNPLSFDRCGPVPVRIPDGSAAQECQRLLPEARVISAFQNVSAVKLAALDKPLTGHVLLCGDDPAAKEAVAALVLDISQLEPLDAGPLRLSGPVEDLTAVLVSINRRYKVNSGIQLTGVAATPRLAARAGG